MILENATPDVIFLLNEAICVLCAQGGITCHLALLSREMSIPCIVGIHDITKIADGTYVCANSYNGKGVVYEIKNI